MAQKEGILTPHQSKLLDLISREKYFAERFYFTGGTALAEFYLKHRFSEDLDFFCEKQEVNPIYISRFLGIHAKLVKLKKLETKRVLGLHSYFLHFIDGMVLKIDFSYYPYPRIERGIKFNNLEVNSIYDIAVDKVHTVVLKPRARDYIDLFFILREKDFQFHKLLLDAKAKFDWDITVLELGARLLEAAEQSDYPRMVKKINHQEWKDFFVEEARKLKKKIFR